MARGKVITNITKEEYAFIDGATGEELTREQFIQRHTGVNASGHRINIPEVTGEEIKGENN